MAVRHGYGKIAGADALVFAYDTGDTRNSYKGEPTTNLLGATGDMAPPNPDTPYDLTTAASNSNVNGTTWDLSLYANNNLAADNGIAWDPYIKGPGFTGAWRLKKRPGGNWETQFQNGLGAVTNTTSIVLSVWCKATVAGVARINANTTRNGSSNWGNSSAYHSGNGEWERLYYVIPANDGVTSINVIRCQVGGTTVNTDVYWRHFQVEYGDHSTQFTAGTRSATQSLLDLTGNTTLNLADAAFDSNAQMTFDGTDTKVAITGLTISATQNKSYEAIIKLASGYNQIGTIIGGRSNSTNVFAVQAGRELRGSEDDEYIVGSSLNTEQWYHVAYTFEFDGSDAYQKLYINGELDTQRTKTTYIDAYVESTQHIGYEHRFDYRFNGDIPVVKVYNKTLTAAEVKQNFNHYKNRFSI